MGLAEATPRGPDSPSEGAVDLVPCPAHGDLCGFAQRMGGRWAGAARQAAFASGLPLGPARPGAQNVPRDGGRSTSAGAGPQIGLGLGLGLALVP